MRLECSLCRARRWCALLRRQGSPFGLALGARRVWCGRLEAAGAALGAPACGVPRERRAADAASVLWLRPFGHGERAGFLNSASVPRRERRVILTRPLRALSARSPHLHQVAPRAAPTASPNVIAACCRSAPARDRLSLTSSSFRFDRSRASTLLQRRAAAGGATVSAMPAQR